MDIVTVIGSGSWGTALSQHLASNGIKVNIWGKDQNSLEDIRNNQNNSNYLPKITLSDRINAYDQLELALENSHAIIISVPSNATRDCVASLKSSNYLKDRTPIITTAKGLEKHSNKRCSEVVKEILGVDYPTFSLSGPSFALEVASGMPSALVLAGDSLLSKESLDACSKLFHRGHMRIYTSYDVIGVELGGVLKNVIAFACGVSDGLKLGMSARSALITRGLKELVMLIEAEGGKKETVFGLSGLGDLILTSTGELSRNRSFGILMGEGMSLKEAEKKVGQTIEALLTAQSALAIAQKNNIEVPIIEQVSEVISGKKSPKKAMEDLMKREQKPEHL